MRFYRLVLQKLCRLFLPGLYELDLQEPCKRVFEELYGLLLLVLGNLVVLQFGRLLLPYSLPILGIGILMYHLLYRWMLSWLCRLMVQELCMPVLQEPHGPLFQKVLEPFLLLLGSLFLR